MMQKLTPLYAYIEFYIDLPESLSLLTSSNVWFSLSFFQLVSFSTNAQISMHICNELLANFWRSILNEKHRISTYIIKFACQHMFTKSYWRREEKKKKSTHTQYTKVSCRLHLLYIVCLPFNRRLDFIFICSSVQMLFFILSTFEGFPWELF